MINYISNLPSDLRTGGFSSMNVATYEALRTRLDVHYVGPINPPFFYSEKIPSKLRRMTGRPGSFFFFSERRMRAIAREVEARRSPDAAIDFFHGFTPWPFTRMDRPYVASSDCTFHDYIEIFHRRGTFTPQDISRIEKAEAAWLAGASKVLLRSRWAADRAVEHYALDPSKVDTVKSCGEIEMPDADQFMGGNRFVFVSTNFEAKGGAVAMAALREVRRRHRDASLTIVGDAPRDLRAEEGVEIAGFLRKDNPADVARFGAILATARALVHPTLGDVSPLIIAEAGYFGCPAISSRRFAIPELIQEGVSGVLLDNPEDPAEIVGIMTRMIEDGEAYRLLRKGAWNWTRNEYSRPQFEERIVRFVGEVMLKRSIAPA